MKILAAGGLLLYAVAAALAGTVDLVGPRGLPLAVDAALLVSGALMAVAGTLTAREDRRAWPIAIAGLILAFATAVYNERALGLGNPFHHVVRGLYTLVVLLATRATLRRGTVPLPARDRRPD